MVFTNEAKLKKFLLVKCKNAVLEAEKKVYATIKRVLVGFYQEFSPVEYERTLQLLHSLVKTNVKSTKNGFEAEIYFDASTLDYATGTWSGETVLNVAMKSRVPHGGYSGGTAVWTTSREILGNIFELLEQELEAQGIPIKKR